MARIKIKLSGYVEVPAEDFLGGEAVLTPDGHEEVRFLYVGDLEDLKIERSDRDAHAVHAPARGKDCAMKRHDYEPGEDTHPMHTDPACKACGRPKKDRVHR